jgi:transcriptional regulator with XRE-family HTH domain
VGYRTCPEAGAVVADELGPRLRELRLMTGLTMDQVAARMGLCGKGRWSVVWRLEKGRRPGVALACVLDYLRAIRFGVMDVLDIVERYTRRPPLLAERAVRALAAAQRVPGASG